jgi:hypothetical protein
MLSVAFPLAVACVTMSCQVRTSSSVRAMDGSELDTEIGPVSLVILSACVANTGDGH